MMMNVTILVKLMQMDLLEMLIIKKLVALIRMERF